MPRKSAASNLVVISNPELVRPPKPTKGASSAVKEVFDEIVRSRPATHFQDTDSHQIQSYCEGIIFARKLAEQIDKQGMILKDGSPHPAYTLWLKTIPRLNQLARALRLAPSARIDARSPRVVNQQPYHPTYQDLVETGEIEELE